MKLPSYSLAFLLLFGAFAGCANTTADEKTTDMTPTPTASPTPDAVTPTPVMTPTPTMDDDHMDDEMKPPTMMECTGNYVTDAAPGTRLGMPELTFTIQEPSDADPCYAFVGPATAQSGWNVMTLNQPGMEFHIMPMYFIGDHTRDEFNGALMAMGGGSPPPTWLVPSGAVGAVTGGQNASTAIDLEPGTYMYFCPIGGHMFSGMIGSLTVTQAETEAAAPEADATITLGDYNFTLPANVTTAVKVIKVVNEGTEPHEAPLARIDAGHTLMEFLTAIESENPTGPPPGILIGGVNAISPGQTAYLLVDLEEGALYGTVCFVRSPTHEDAEHLKLGMFAEFTVSA